MSNIIHTLHAFTLPPLVGIHGVALHCSVGCSSFPILHTIVQSQHVIGELLASSCRKDYFLI